MSTLLDLEASVQLRNVGAKPFRGKVAIGRYFHLEPGQERTVPWRYAVMWFGDPTIGDDDERYRELQYVRCLHGQHDPTNMSGLPEVEVYDTDTGRRIYMLLEDPNGEKAASASITGESTQVHLSPEVAALRTELAATQTMVRLLVEQLQRQGGVPSDVLEQIKGESGAEGVSEGVSDGTVEDLTEPSEPAEPAEPVDPVDGTTTRAAVNVDAAAVIPGPEPEVKPTAAKPDRPVRNR